MFPDPVASVLAAYAPATGTVVRVESLGQHGGFSGAQLWRVTCARGLLCLRAAGPGESADHLWRRHGWMRRGSDAGLTFMPRLLTTGSGDTVVLFDGRPCELMEWLPGQADYRARPSPARLEAAAMALARVHRAWANGRSTLPCPAVARRRAALRLPLPELSARVGPRRVWLEAIRAAVLPWLDRAADLLPPTDPLVAVQPCLRDVWHAHLLFQGDTLTGLVDYANADLDTPATDLARLLGSLLDDDDDRWQVGLTAYRTVRPLTAAEEGLTRRLDRAGVVASLANWLRWLAQPGRGSEDDERVRPRVQELLERVRRW